MGLRRGRARSRRRTRCAASTPRRSWPRPRRCCSSACAQAALEAGVTMVAPETVLSAADTKLGRDVTIEPYVVFGPGVTVEDGAIIRSFSHLEGAHVGEGAIVGPFARLRPGAELGENVHVGNFVEVKEAAHRGRRQGQPPHLYRRRPGRRGRQYRRRHHHLQLRRRRQAPHRHRRGRLHRLELGAGRAGRRSATAPMSAPAR